jgi:leader peptidase (prepilin peptidase)/N-methyltransferase
MGMRLAFLVPALILASAIAGSFLATILVRWPQGRSVARGRSCCDGCGRVLKMRDLVPLLSWLLVRGRCRSCGGRIDPRHPAVELAAASAGLIAALAHGWPLALATAILGWWLLLLAALDTEHQWLPDRLTLPLWATGLMVAAFGLGPTLEARLIGSLLGFTSLALVRRAYRRVRGREGLGGGDPKLLGALGAWLGWQTLPLLILGAALLGLAAAALAHFRGQTVTGATPLPFGAYMAVAGWALWLVTA